MMFLHSSLSFVSYGVFEGFAVRQMHLQSPNACVLQRRFQVLKTCRNADFTFKASTEA